MPDRPPPPRKPMISARRVSLFERDIRVGLSSAAIEILLERASVLSEGQLQPSGYFGSTMITIDASRAAELVAESCDVATVQRLGGLVGADERFRERARAVGLREARRLAGKSLEGAEVDLRIRTAGPLLHVDLDVGVEIRHAAEAL